jgi:hypothetical protein
MINEHKIDYNIDIGYLKKKKVIPSHNRNVGVKSSNKHNKNLISTRTPCF